MRGRELQEVTKGCGGGALRVLEKARAVCALWFDIAAQVVYT